MTEFSNIIFVLITGPSLQQAAAGQLVERVVVVAAAAAALAARALAVAVLPR